ncbi:hypothetical protein M427DRAFT_54414 [Gonapodya prolifera JEL478]|uniref:SH3 domain-containing protein n=1 Tax=Gonapodya prolifera (strain JEL478) TaxID=1344416 RepID=A0A139AM33_GONPJ|nr:hypothetical protein M427DRAFT_54414 [Gonapodya prolifera JEL478]|eukprot:KXS17837.1 hypothetical protein M427DRAFT_54414 [Gonapodya prolifera JEL478]
MSTTLNPELIDAELIDAVEAGSEADVKRLIEAGAIPDARKRVTLRAQALIGHHSYEWKEDTVQCESALVLAILHARVAVVKVLLEKGARVNGEVDWRVGNRYGSGNWTKEQWRRQRWERTTSFPSALALAIGGGGTATLYDGGKYYSPPFFPSGELKINLRGGAVRVNYPATEEDAHVKFTVQPNVEIVRLLLAYGARVTNVEINAARLKPNLDFIRTLESHQHSPIPRPVPPGPSPLEQANAAHAAQVQDLTARIEAAESRAVVAEGKAEEKASQLAESRRTIALVQAQNTALQAENMALRTEKGALALQVTSLRTRVTTLDQDVGTLRDRNTSLHQENSNLNFHNTTLHREIVSLSHAQTSPQAPGRPSRNKGRVMFAIASYMRQEDDEIEFNAGDELFVILEFADGWARGVHMSTTTVGYFPISYVETNPPFGPPSQNDPPPTTIRLESRAQLNAPRTTPTSPRAWDFSGDVAGPPVAAEVRVESAILLTPEPGVDTVAIGGASA